MSKVAQIAGCCLLASSCLPADTRPSPGSVYVTAAPSDETRNGFTTEDGWQITFDRFVTSVGSIDLDSDPNSDEDIETCSAYSEARYDRVFDFTAVDHPQKVGLVYGRGLCSVEYRFRAPSDDSLIGTGATAEDVQRMRLQQADAYTEDEEARVSLIVVATATSGEETKRLQWTFRHQYELDRCVEPSSKDEYVSVHELADQKEVELTIQIRAQELFRTDNDDAAPTQFGVYADADADADGNVTMGELDEADVPFGRWEEDEQDEGFDDEPREAPETLLEALYVWLLPRVSRIEGGGPCRAERRGR